MRPTSPSLYDEKSLAQLAQLQRSHHWDLEKSIPWETSIDLNRPLVALDDDAIFFPGAGSEERLAISQMMGLMIASSIFEMEECLIRLRKECWEQIHSQTPVSPEFVDLGDLFFEEEHKHSRIFRRYAERFAAESGIDFNTLAELLPTIQNTRTEYLLRQEMKAGGHGFWWIVAMVEQEFLLIYHALRPHKDRLEPLYYSLHERHFEEEARHAPFPYLMIELLTDRYPGAFNRIHSKASLAAAQLLQTVWAFSSLKKMENVKKLQGKHPLFDALIHARPLMEKLPPFQVLWKMTTSAPYVSSLLNPTAHRKILQFAKKTGSISLPFPQYENKKLVSY